MSDSQRPCCTVPERIFNGWIVEAHDHCTCEGEFGHHESSCGMIPLVHLRDLDGWDELEAEVGECYRRKGLVEGWDVGYRVGLLLQVTYNPYRVEDVS